MLHIIFQVVCWTINAMLDLPSVGLHSQVADDVEALLNNDLDTDEDAEEDAEAETTCTVQSSPQAPCNIAV